MFPDKKEDVLKAICLYTIWNPKESILYARKKGVFRYRIGNYRIICEIQEEKVIVLVLDIGHRKNIYEF